MPFMIDHVAKKRALRQWVLPECLHVPIAAVDEGAIRSYIGDVEQVLSKGEPNKALLIKAKNPPPIDTRLPIWELKASTVFHRRMQVWVHVAYTRYRPAYLRAFPTEDISDKIMSHAMNRRMATLIGFQYVRITPVSRGANASSGALSEKWGVALHNTPEQIAANKRHGAFIQYAALDGLMLMLDMKVGGGVMDRVNEGQGLVQISD